MPNINLGLSVFKREAKDVQDVLSTLQSNGWSQTGQILNGRVTYLENSGFSITVIDGPAGTAIIPSGPLRGKLFGDSGAEFSRTSVIGAGGSNNNDDQVGQQVSDRGGELT